jgi:hypothetical protein
MIDSKFAGFAANATVNTIGIDRYVANLNPSSQGLPIGRAHAALSA